MYAIHKFFLVFPFNGEDSLLVWVSYFLYLSNCLKLGGVIKVPFHTINHQYKYSVDLIVYK